MSRRASPDDDGGTASLFGDDMAASSGPQIRASEREARGGPASPDKKLRREPSAQNPPARGGTFSRLAAAGRWVGERDRGRGWEDFLAEFLGAILTWAGIGWLLDRWLGTDPWLMIAGIVLGNALGIYLLWLHSDPERASAARDSDDGGAR